MEKVQSSAVDARKRKNRMVDWAVFIALPRGNLEPLNRYRVLPEDRDVFKKKLRELVAAGCDQRALVTALWMANTVQVESFPSATRIRSLAKRVRDLADEISRLEASHFMAYQNEDAVSKCGRGHFALPKWLRKRAEMYDEWLQIAKKKGSPRRELLDRVKRVYPVLYVKWATNRPFYEKVATLLRLSGIADVKSAAQFEREVRAFESDYPITTSDIRLLLQQVHARKLTYYADTPARKRAELRLSKSGSGRQRR
jgi:hypothetical protein